MGRHGAQEPPPHRRAPVAIISLVLLVVVAIGLGIWWWSLRGHTDPIDASPVPGYAVVVSSPGCDGPSTGTVVDLLDVTPAVRATVDACGDTENQRIAVEYLSGRPTQVRVAGTKTAGTSTAGRWLPLAILLAGVLAVGATIVLLMDRRRSRQISASHRISVAELRRTVAEERDSPVRAARFADPATGLIDRDEAAADLDQTTRLALLIDDQQRPPPSGPVIGDDLLTRRPVGDGELFTHQDPADR